MSKKSSVGAAYFALAGYCAAIYAAYTFKPEWFPFVVAASLLGALSFLLDGDRTR